MAHSVTKEYSAYSNLICVMENEIENSICCMVITTTDSLQNAQLIAKTLLDNKLAACVQVDEVQSMFYYQSAYSRVKELRLTVKALSSSYKKIEDAILLQHTYQVPQIIKINISDGLSEYLKWIKDCAVTVS